MTSYYWPVVTTLCLEKNTNFCFLAKLLEKVTHLNEYFRQIANEILILTACLKFSFRLVTFLRVMQENKSGCFFLNTLYVSCIV